MLTEPELAAYLKVNPRTLKRWRDANKITFVRLPGGDVRYRMRDVEGLLDSRTRGPRR